MEQDLKEFRKEFSGFVKQYELDMRGDKDLANGNKGVIGEIRDIKQDLKKNPSVLWLFKNKTKETITFFGTLFLFMSALFIDEARVWLFSILGISLP